MKIPEHIELANLPTRIDRLEGLSEKFKKNIYIKRDDQTGTEISGNKVRKLEFAVREALDQGADYLITCGGIQSNHARATAAVASRLGLGSVLVLRGDKDSQLEGNYLLDELLGADVRFVTGEEYSKNRTEIMEAIKEELRGQGHKAYILPEGASNGIGSFGYMKALEEISQQEEEMGLEFDAIVTTVGSAGTYAGLVYGNQAAGRKTDIIGINICDSAEFFKDKTQLLLEEIGEYTGQDLKIAREDLKIIDGHTGDGYAISRPDEIEFIRDFARSEGVILDPVYTGKSMFGLVKELEKDSLKAYNNILFIHTGGIFGWTAGAAKFL